MSYDLIYGHTSHVNRNWGVMSSILTRDSEIFSELWFRILL